MATSTALVFLLSSTIVNQNQAILLLLSQRQKQQQSSLPSSSLPIPSLAYADKIKIKNKLLIKGISDKVVKNNGIGNGNGELQNLLQQIQTQNNKLLVI